MANILAVDDDRDLCTLLKTALERDGHTVETRCAGCGCDQPRSAAGQTAFCWTS